MEACELTILMPCLNEAETLATCIRKARQFLNEHQIAGEVLIADNGSQDGSEQIAEQNGARVIHVKQKGYGAALKGGIDAASGKFVIMGDADDSYDFSSLMPFLAKLREGYDLVMGNRFAGGIVDGAMPILNRYLGNPILSLIGRIFYSSKVGDFHCGLRGFARDKCRALGLRGDGMEFASEMVVKASLNKLKIAEVPTRLHPDGRSRKPHLRPWRDGWRHLRLLLLFSPRWLFLYPGTVLMMLGLFMMGMIAAGPLQLDGINLDIHTMLFSGMFIVVGLQAVCFAVFARLVANAKMRLGASDALTRYFSLERGLLVGGILLISGLMGAGYSFWFWMHQSFGNLIPEHIMRILIPSTTSMIAGMQVVFASFFMSLLGMHYAD